MRRQRRRAKRQPRRSRLEELQLELRVAREALKSAIAEYEEHPEIPTSKFGVEYMARKVADLERQIAELKGEPARVRQFTLEDFGLR